MTETPEDMNLLAAEYVLRVLPASEMAAATERLSQDAAFAAAVTAWEAHLAPLAEELPDVAPRAAVKTALQDRLFADASSSSFWSGLQFWRGLALASMVALAAMVWINLSRPDTPVHVAEIVSTEQDFRVIAVVDKGANEVILTKITGDAPEGRILQVWAHGPDAPAMSVGLWPEGDSVRLPLPPVIAAVTGTLTVGVSEEPVGGSPTGSPTGRVFGTVDIANVAG